MYTTTITATCWTEAIWRTSKAVRGCPSCAEVHNEAMIGRPNYRRTRSNWDLIWLGWIVILVYAEVHWLHLHRGWWPWYRPKGYSAFSLVGPRGPKNGGDCNWVVHGGKVYWTNSYLGDVAMTAREAAPDWTKWENKLTVMLAAGLEAENSRSKSWAVLSTLPPIKWQKSCYKICSILFHCQAHKVWI